MKKFPATEERKLQTEIDNLMNKEKLRLVYFLDHIVSKKFGKNYFYYAHALP